MNVIGFPRRGHQCHKGAALARALAHASEDVFDG